MALLRRLAAGLGVAGLFLGALWLAGQWVLPPLPLSANDLDLVWRVAGKGYFVPGAEAGTLTTNPELLRLDQHPVSFRVAKKPGALRVFCVGGSTTHGWPFHHLLSYPRLMGRILRDVLPGREVEVIDAGVLASDSTGDRVLARELLDYQPDLLVVLAGRNERWNYALHAGWKGALLRRHARLLRGSHLYQWARRLTALGGRSRYDHFQAVRDWADRGQAPMTRPEPRGLFERNLEGLVDEARARGIQTVLLTHMRYPGETSFDEKVFAPAQRELARRRDLLLIDSDAAFHSSKTPLAELMLGAGECHPDVAGYWLLAETVARELARAGALAPGAAWRWERLRPRDAYLKELGVTPAALAGPYRMSATELEHTGYGESARRLRRKAGGS